MSSNEISAKSPNVNALQKIAESSSGPPSADQEQSSVYDFLYHDARRIAAFLAQFNTYGILNSVKAQEAVGRSSSTKASSKADINLVALAKAGVAVDGTVTDDEKDATEQTFDPLWKNATTLLDYLAERKLIKRNLDAARIGEFVLLTGRLAAFDLGMLKEAWKLPAFKKAMIAGANQANAQETSSTNRHERRKEQKFSATNKVSVENEAAVEFLSILPHTVQGTVRASDKTVWFNLREDSMIISPAELLLKHGMSIAGEWSVIGVLDAHPYADTNEIDIYDQLIAAMSIGELLSSLGTLGPIIRNMLGRPQNAFGITPLMIFRQISATPLDELREATEHVT